MAQEIIRLHPFQRRAVEAVHAEWQQHQATLLVLPTGCGKTIAFSRILADRAENGRGIVLAHREELVAQAAAKIQRVTGMHADIEMAAQWADQVWDKFRAPIIVSTIQTQISGRNGDGRMTRFRPTDFATAVIDEAHHATSASYRRVVDHYLSHSQCRLLGVTATPNRADEEALGQVFGSCAYAYDLVDAVRDGWLVPITHGVMPLDDVDLSGVHTSGDDLNGSELAEILEREKILLGMADAIWREHQGRKTLVFAASVEHAKRLAEIFNRYEYGCARMISGKTPKDERRQLLSDYAERKFRILCNCAVFLEGFDDPSIEVVVPKPTKSLPLLQQMIGRGTRTLPGVIDSREWEDDAQRELGLEGETDCASLRRKLIAESAKPHCEILDLYCQAGRHKLVTAADALGGRYTEQEVERAKHDAKSSGKPQDVMERLEAARAALAREQQEAERRKHIRGRAIYTKRSIDPFDVLNLTAQREYGWERGRRPSEKMIALLERQGIDASKLTFSEAGQLIGEIKRRWDAKVVSHKQAKILQRFGFPGDMKSADAKPVLDRIFAAGFRISREQLHHEFAAAIAPTNGHAAADGPPAYDPPPAYSDYEEVF